MWVPLERPLPKKNVGGIVTRISSRFLNMEPYEINRSTIVLLKGLYFPEGECPMEDQTKSQYYS